MSQFRTIVQSADLLGRERYVELSLFSALGSRALEVDSSDEMLWLASSAQSHAWRARLLEELLPVSLGLPGVDDATRSPGSLSEEIVQMIRGQGDGIGILDTLGRVLYPQMLSAYRAHLVSCSPAADLATALVLRRAIGDLECRLDELHEVLELDEGPLRSTSVVVAELLERLGGPFGPLE